MNKQSYKKPESEFTAEVYYDYMLCQSPGAGENEGTTDDPLD